MDTVHRHEIRRALRFISAHLTDAITVADVARAAHLSEFHLNRVFHAVVGESIGRFITRRRLELAALRLAYEPDWTITDVALSSGYSSASNFTKAFTAYFGCSPSRLRDPDPTLPPAICQLTSRYGKDFRPSELYTLQDPRNAEARTAEARACNERVRFETSDGRTFATLASPPGYGVATLEQTWVELIDRARQLALCDDHVDAWGIAHDCPTITAPDRLRYHACIPCQPSMTLSPPLFQSHMHAGRYAVFDYTGSVDGLADAHRSIYSCWFPESSVAPADFVPLDHYVTDFPVDGRITLEMWFKIRPRR